MASTKKNKAAQAVKSVTVKVDFPEDWKHIKKGSYEFSIATAIDFIEKGVAKPSKGEEVKVAETLKAIKEANEPEED